MKTKSKNKFIFWSFISFIGYLILFPVITSFLCSGWACGLYYAPIWFWSSIILAIVLIILNIVWKIKKQK